MQRPPAHGIVVRASQKPGAVFAGICLTLLGLLSGCASPGFDIVQPPEFARHISTDFDTVVELKPIAYRLRAIEDHLVIRIFNPGDQPVSVLGPESYVVDPAGQSHAIASQTIPPGSFVKLILPPLPPNQTPAGPYLSFQISSGGVSMDNPMPKLNPQTPGNPASDTWTWSGDRDVKLTFTYRIENAQPFTHSFSIRRHKP